MLSEEKKKKIDAMPEAEIREEVNKGNRSRFQGEKFDYLKTRLEKIESDDQHNQRKEDVAFKEKDIHLAQEANDLSKIAIWVSIGSVLFAGVALIVSILTYMYK